jgi:hypothetical protein
MFPKPNARHLLPPEPDSATCGWCGAPSDFGENRRGRRLARRAGVSGVSLHAVGCPLAPLASRPGLLAQAGRRRRPR